MTEHYEQTMIGNNRVLQLLRLPARLTIEETETLLGFHSDSVRYLAKCGLLKALGATVEVQVFFASAYIRRLCSDEKWLTKATESVRAHHQQRNFAQKARHSLRVQ
jgi:hypothetical protein